MAASVKGTRNTMTKQHPIHDIQIRPLKQICDERGKIMHMLRSDESHFTKFGEIYFSVVYEGKIKAWHLHKRMILNYAVPFGKILLTCFDDRKDSPTNGVIQEIPLGEDNYNLVTIPPGIWNGFKGLGEKFSIVANCASVPHDPDEIVRKDPFCSDVPYIWK